MSSKTLFSIYKNGKIYTGYNWGLLKRLVNNL